MPQPDPKKALLLLERLLEEIARHFACEEQILIRLGYPRAEEHREIHRQLVDKALSLKAEYLRGGQFKAFPFFPFILDDVVLGHMLKDDQLFFSYTRKVNGAAETKK